MEHPVTELTTGTDLVQHQIKIAAGEKLPFKQENLEQKGHAIECRIYAEDPHNNFLPSPGKILYLKEPQGPGIRHDCGIYTGWNVPIYYDPILAKLIVWAEDRESACQRMIKALDDYVILGVQTSIRFLRDLIGHPRFRKGETTTSFIQDHFSDWTGEKDSEEKQALALLAAAFDSMQEISSVKGSPTAKAEISLVDCSLRFFACKISRCGYPNG